MGGYPDSVIDTSEHHVYNGFMFIKMERPDDALREFDQGLSLNPGSSAARRGMGIGHGMKGSFDSAFALMEQARTYAETNEEKALVCTGMMRLHTLQKGKDWLRMVEENFRQALSFSSDLPDAYFQLGMAYRDAYRLAHSKDAFGKVIALNKDFASEAQAQISALEKIEKVMPRSELGRGIIFVERITRAHVAGLLDAETNIEQYFESRAAHVQEWSPAWKGRFIPAPSDVASHPLEGIIEKVLQLQIQGLGTFADGTFRPDEYMTRAGFAVIIADIITRVPGVSLFPPSPHVMPSPFKDVRPGAPHFNAIMVATEGAGVMEAEEGVFNPMGTLSGVEALLFLRKMEEKLGIF
jgi:hypothetical protein